MSIEIAYEQDGKVRIRVDREGFAAVSDVRDARELIQEIASKAQVQVTIEGGEA